MSRLGRRTRWLAVWIAAIVFLVFVLGLGSPDTVAAPPGAPALGFGITPTSTFTPTPSSTPTDTATPTATFTPTHAPTPTPTRKKPSLSSCDLEIKKWAEPTVVRRGDKVVFTIQVTNHGQKACTHTIVIDDIPEYLEILNVQTTQGTASWAGQKVTVEVGVVGQDFVVTIRIETKVRDDAPAPVSVINVAVVDSIDISGSRPSNPVGIDIIAGPGCAPFISKRAEPAQVQPGDRVLFTIKVTNRGPVDLVGARVVDRLPEYLEIRDVQTDQGTARRKGQEVTVDVGSIGPGFTVTIRIYARVREDAPASLTIENVASLRSDECPDASAMGVLTVGSLPLMPSTGGFGAWWLLVAGLGAALFAVGMALSRRA